LLVNFFLIGRSVIDDRELFAHSHLTLMHSHRVAEDRW
jgi:hypothetical protein